MASFSEYAALARHLHELRRSGERTAAQLAEERGSTGAAVDRLDQRLVAQYQRLSSLGLNIDKPIPPPPPGVIVTGVTETITPASGGAPVVRHLPPPQFATPPQFVPPPQFAPPVQRTGSGPATGPAPPTGPASARQPGSAAYPELAGGPTRPALPAVPATGPDAAGPVPGQRPPISPQRGAAGPESATPLAVPVDPARELELARQAADGADVMIVQAETMAQQPPLLPSMTPLARATTVYLGCAGVLTIVIWILLTIAEVRGLKGLDRSTVAVFSWSCAGLPTMAFFAGYLVLGIWGKPRIVNGRPARYTRLGFLICFLAAPLAFLGYYLV